MPIFTEQENRERKDALDQTRDHIEADLHREFTGLRSEIAELRQLLQANVKADREDLIAALNGSPGLM